METAEAQEQIMYKAELNRDGFLIISEVVPYTYNRWGFGDLGKTKSEAVDKLRARVMGRYEDELKRIDFQRGLLEL